MYLDLDEFYKKVNAGPDRRLMVNFEVMTSKMPDIKKFGEVNFNDIWSFRDTAEGTTCVYLCGSQDIMMLRLKFSEHAVCAMNSGTYLY